MDIVKTTNITLYTLSLQKDELAAILVLIDVANKIKADCVEGKCDKSPFDCVMFDDAPQNFYKTKDLIEETLLKNKNIFRKEVVEIETPWTDLFYIINIINQFYYAPIEEQLKPTFVSIEDLEKKIEILEKKINIVDMKSQIESETNREIIDVEALKKKIKFQEDKIEFLQRKARDAE